MEDSKALDISYPDVGVASSHYSRYVPQSYLGTNVLTTDGHLTNNKWCLLKKHETISLSIF